jgi:hypothetical protein
MADGKRYRAKAFRIIIYPCPCFDGNNKSIDIPFGVHPREDI